MISFVSNLCLNLAILFLENRYFLFKLIYSFAMIFLHSINLFFNIRNILCQRRTYCLKFLCLIDESCLGSLYNFFCLREGLNFFLWS